MSQVICRFIIITPVQVSSFHRASGSQIIFLLIWLCSHFPSDFFCNFNFLLRFNITFSVSDGVYRKGLLMISLQVPQHSDIFQIQRRVYLFFYSIKFQHLHSTLHFQEHKEGGKKAHLSSNTEPELLLLLLMYQRKSCRQEVLLFSVLRRYKEHKESPKLHSIGIYVGREMEQSILSIQSWQHTSLDCQSCML